MPIAGQSWSDRKENYTDAWVLSINGTTATAVNSSGNSPYLFQPIVLFGIHLSGNQAAGSGDLSLIDATASGDSATLMWRVNIASGTPGAYSYEMSFPRGLIFTKGLMVSATTVTATLNLLYKNRY